MQAMHQRGWFFFANFLDNIQEMGYYLQIKSKIHENLRNYIVSIDPLLIWGLVRSPWLIP